jgi:MYXO-CTERM domain-containing protein
MTIGPLVVLMAGSGDAEAFCGTYVGQADADLVNGASQMAVVRQDGVTTLTMVNDYAGDLDDFAFVIPVPKGLSEDDVSVVGEHLVRTLEVYSGPRLVSYSCEDFGGWERPEAKSTGHTPLMALPLALGGCSAESNYVVADEGAGIGLPGSEEADESAVTVEAEFAAGEYEFVVVSAEDGEGLFGWLEAHGYSVGEDADVMLGSYVEAGHDFLAARVALEAVPAGSASLSPIQLRYASEGFGLPLRLGTLNSPGVQDLILYTITPEEVGAVGIANYPQAIVEDECMVELGDVPFVDWYEDQLEQAFQASEGFVWFDEYSWTLTPRYAQEFYATQAPACDPCPSAHQYPAGAGVTADDPLPDLILRDLGVDLPELARDSGWWNVNPNLSVGRLHLRYEAGAVDQDLVLYTSGLSGYEQMRFIEYKPSMESSYPVCGEGWVTDEPGFCEYGLKPTPMLGLASYGCSSTPAPSSLAGVLALLGGLVLLRRRA